jgi:hypothetical protein
MIVGTPSGVTLAPEGGAHQSIGSPLIGMSQDGLAAFEPAFADELAVIMEWAFDYMQRMAKAIRTNAPGCATRPAARSISAHHQPDRAARQACRRGFPPGRDRRRLLAAQARPQLRGGHRLPGGRGARSDPGCGPHCRDRRDVGVLAVTSADRLNAGWTAAQRARARGNPSAKSHIETLTGRPAPALQDCHRHRRPSRHACLDRLGARPPDDSRSASSISARPARSAISTGISASMPRPSCRQPSVCLKDAGACRRCCATTVEAAPEKAGSSAFKQPLDEIEQAGTAVAAQALGLDDGAHG